MRFFESPPEYLTIDGVQYPIDTDFRTWIRFQQIITQQKTDEEKTADLLQFIAALGLPFSDNTLSAMVEFFKAGDISKAKESKGPVYNFETDGSLIFSAFLTQYNQDLTTEKMHWWRFKSMFSGLSDQHMITKVMWARGADKSKMSKEMREYAEALCAAYPIEEEKRKMTLEERNQGMRDYIARRYEETKKGRLSALRGNEQPGND